MVFLFLSLRESQHGRIEPDILPISSSSSTTLLQPQALPTNKNPPRFQGSDFQSYITTWDVSDKPALFRKCVCILALVLHIPINVISILSYGLSFWLFLGIVLSLLNLGCVGYALWKLDAMRGERVFYSRL